MIEEKLYRVGIAAYRDREFYGGYSELTISKFVSVIYITNLIFCFVKLDTV